MKTQIIKTFIEDFSELYSGCLKATQNAIKAKYFNKLQDIKRYVEHLEHTNDDSKYLYETLLLEILSKANFHRYNYNQDTYEYATFNSIFDLTLETLKDFHNAA